MNKNNPLGTGGKLAVAYDVVLKQLWMNNKASAISPTSLKRAIALFAPRFAGSLQHDAQEFLAYLLDGLHEDLNRITSAPYVEMPDVTDGQNMAVAGARAWDAHRKRNDSLVLDTFYGQFQSTCICPKCKKVSVSFDAFNHVSLEIPQLEHSTVTIPVLFFGEEGGKRPLRYAVTVARRGSVADLKLNLAELAGVSQSNLAFADIYNHTIYELLHDNKAVHTIGANDVVAAFEVEPFTARSIHTVAVNTIIFDGSGSLLKFIERLDERNMWLPNILIIHLKRFAFKHTLRREKMDTFVEFPVDGLNMEPHCAKATSCFIDANFPAEYDLFGVINHYGRLGFGHYTAFARHWDENAMGNTFAAFDDSSAALVQLGQIPLRTDDCEHELHIGQQTAIN
ncbi:MAG: hypothetical protein SGBAC_006639 [Bacillariaceae sp.]